MDLGDCMALLKAAVRGGLTQRELARRARVSEGHLSRVLAGKL